jgi:LysM repeat protein
MSFLRLIAGLLVFLLAPGMILAAEPITVSLPFVGIEAGQSLVVEAQIQCIEEGCSAFDMTIEFNPAVIQVDQIELGPFLGEQVFTAENSIDNEAGIVRLAAAALGDPPPDSEPILLRLHITPLTSGVTELQITRLDIGDLIGNPLETLAVDGGVAVLGENTAPAIEPLPTQPAADAPISQPEAVEQPTCQYQVRPGDTLSGIAIANHVSVDQLVEMNGISNARIIRVGDTLTVPASNCRAAVQSGDVIQVHDCRHLGSNVFEWYSVRRVYDASGNPIREVRIGGPYTGQWRPGCPAGEPPPRPSSGGRHSGDDNGSGSGGTTPVPDDDNDVGVPIDPCTFMYCPPINDDPPVVAP